MREIKFRAWNKLAHKMAAIDSLDFALDSYRAHTNTSSGSGHLADIELMQFTGLLDKNGKEIYEGDILQDIWGMAQEVIFFTDEIHCLTGFMLKRIVDPVVMPVPYSVTFMSWLSIAEVITNRYERAKALEELNIT